MKKITVNDVESCITEAIKNNKKNILFVSITLENQGVRKWFKNNTEYRECCAKPAPLYDEVDGRLVKNEGYYVIPDNALVGLNDEKSVLYVWPFGEECTYGFEEFLNIVKYRFYVNKFPEGTTKTHSVDKMALFIAFSTPSGCDGFSLDEKYYELFDEVYLLD